MTCWNIVGALCKTNGISKSGALQLKLPGAYCTTKSDMNMTKNVKHMICQVHTQDTKASVYI